MKAFSISTLLLALGLACAFWTDEARGSHGHKHHKRCPAKFARAGTTSTSGPTCEPASGMATQYWDCCKVAAAWPGHETIMSQPVASCAADGVTRLPSNTAGGCQDGAAFACNDQQPFVSPTNSNLSYAIGARYEKLGVDTFYGACYAIAFKELPGKTLVFQAVNTGDDYAYNQIDIQVPGGGVGYYNGCPLQWHSPPNGWGRRYGGVETRQECDQLPAALQPGCQWRFDWLAPPDHPNGINPTIKSMCRVQCPSILTNVTGAVRFDDDGFPPAPQ